MKTLIFSLMAVMIFGGSAIAAKARSESVRVQINKEKKLPKAKLTIRFLELVEDSRCPTGVQCIWAGNGKIKVSVKRGTAAAKVFEMDTNGAHNTITHGGYKITLKGLTPHPAENVRIDRNGYVATFDVGK